MGVIHKVASPGVMLCSIQAALQYITKRPEHKNPPKISTPENKHANSRLITFSPKISTRAYLHTCLFSGTPL